MVTTELMKTIGRWKTWRIFYVKIDKSPPNEFQPHLEFPIYFIVIVEKKKNSEEILPVGYPQ